MRVIDRKLAQAAALVRTYDDIRWRPPTFQQLLDAAVAIHPHAPRIEVSHVDYPDFEAWLGVLGWHVADRGVHPWNNTFSVVARRVHREAATG